MGCLKQVAFSIISVIFFVFVLLPLHIYRLLVILLPKTNGIYKFCSLRTGIYAGLKLKSPQMGNIIIQAKLEGPFRIQELKTSFEKKLEIYPDLKCYVTSFMGYPCLMWEENFSLENHIVEESEPLDLQQLKAKLLFEKYPEKRSPWCLHLTKICEEYIVLLRIHHVLGDGYSILQLLKEEPINRPFIPVKKWQIPLLLTKTVFNLFPPLPNIPSSGRTFSAGSVFIAEAKTALELKMLKEIKRLKNIRFAAIPFFAFAFAVRKHLERKECKIENLAGLTMPAPSPVRNTGKRMMNELSFCATKIPIGEKDLMKGLKQFDQFMNDTVQDVILQYYAAGIYGSLPQLVWERIPWIQAMLIGSDFPGPQEKLEFGGICVNDLSFQGQFLSSKNGVGMMSLSYNGLWKPSILVWRGFCDSQEEAQRLVDSVTDTVKKLYTEVIINTNSSEPQPITV